jgi:hypothetical protein
MSLCKFKNALGIPNKGIHKYRLLNIAIIDVIFTIIGGFVLSKSFNINFYKITIFLFILGIVLHRLFCVRTTIDKLLFK